MRYVFLGESSAPQFAAINEHVMSSVTMAQLDAYFTKCVQSEGSVKQDCVLPGSTDKGKGAVEEFVRQAAVDNDSVVALVLDDDARMR